MFDRPLGPQFSIDHRSISSVEVCWLIFSVFIVRVRCGMLENASWLKKTLCLLGVFGFEWWVMNNRSLDSKIPSRVAVRAIYLMVFGIETTFVVCRVEIFVRVPMKIDISIRRVNGLVMVFVSL